MLSLVEGGGGIVGDGIRRPPPKTEAKSVGRGGDGDGAIVGGNGSDSRNRGSEKAPGSWEVVGTNSWSQTYCICKRG